MSLQKKNKLVVMTIVGTRPEIIRLSRVIHQLDSYCEHVLVHTGQNYDYELNQIFFDELGIRKPDIFLNSAQSGNSSANTIGNIISNIDEHLSTYTPDAVLILGDTNSSLAAISVKRRQIPIFHMEAGNRCYDQRVPEEINRRIVDHIADVNLTYSQIARQCLLDEGLPTDKIICTGSPMFEVLNYYGEEIEKSPILRKLDLEKHNFFLVSAHREENIGNDINFDKLVTILNDMAESYDIPVIVSTHPRTKKRIKDLNIVFHENIQLLKPLGFFDYVKLQVESKVVLSDSGTITEESSILNFPALNIREAHERPEGMEEGSVMMVGLSKERIQQALTILEDQSREEERLIHKVADYQSSNVSHKIVRLIHSYTDYIQRTVWKQY